MNRSIELWLKLNYTLIIQRENPCRICGIAAGFFSMFSSPNLDSFISHMCLLILSFAHLESEWYGLEFGHKMLEILISFSFGWISSLLINYLCSWCYWIVFSLNTKFSHFFPVEDLVRYFFSKVLGFWTMGQGWLVCTGIP